MNIRTAQEHLRVAHALEHLPQVRAHFAAGVLSYSKVLDIEPTTIVCNWDGTRLTHDDLSFALAALNAGLLIS
jgi:hypothetical protein